MEHLFSDVWMFLCKHIHPIEEPRQLLPIVALVIAWYLLKKSIDFYKKDKRFHFQQLEQEHLLILLRNANLKIAFLCMALVFFATVTLFVNGAF